MDESASQINIGAATPDELRVLLGKLMSGSAAIREALGKEHPAPAKALCDADPGSDADIKAEEVPDGEPLEGDDLDDDEDGWWARAKSTTHRKEWMTFGRRFEQADAAVKYPQVAALWNSKGQEAWDACRSCPTCLLQVVCFLLLYGDAPEKF